MTERSQCLCEGDFSDTFRWDLGRTRIFFFVVIIEVDSRHNGSGGSATAASDVCSDGRQ